MPLTFYRCAKCRKEFDHLVDAAACEHGHPNVKGAKAQEYTIGAYPFLVDVSFADGTTKTYVLEDMAHTLR